MTHTSNTSRVSQDSPVAAGAGRRSFLGGDTYGNRQNARFSDGQYMNAGPGRIPQWMVTLDYCRELGVPVEVFTNENANAYLFNDKSGMKAPVRYRTAKADMYGYVAELLAKAGDKGALDRQVTAAFTSARKAVTALHSRVLA